MLEEVIVNAFAQDRMMKEIPAPIHLLNNKTLDVFSPSSVVHAMNTIPGVRMEERSPGSYRFNIRGSALRSPFGVRNVKVYYNDLPVTDPGGNTFLNQFGFHNFKRVEVLRGPGSALYGAGTGGVILIDNLEAEPGEGVRVDYSMGSYGLQNVHASVTSKHDEFLSRLSYEKQSSNGYREHSSLLRQTLSWTGTLHSDKSRLKTSFLFGDLNYNTPGALTREEFEANPKDARPGSAFFPGAVEAQASVTQRSFLTGLSYENRIKPNWLAKTVLYGMFTELRNPNIRNYDKSSVPHGGGRFLLRYTTTAGQTLINIFSGIEYQKGFTSVAVHRNYYGNRDTLISTDEINNRHTLVFSQATIDHKQWLLTLAGSINAQRLNVERFHPQQPPLFKQVYENAFSPRVSIMKRFTGFNIYTAVSSGFSPPTTAETLPTGGSINLSVEAEKGINYETGIKGRFLKWFYLDVNAFYFSLRNTIVQRRTAGGGDFFVNAGRTRQMGIESHLSWSQKKNETAGGGFGWISHTWHRFHYKEFIQGDNDYSGNAMPGIPRHVISAGYEHAFRNGFSTAATIYANSKMALSDANKEFAEGFIVPSIRAAYESRWKKLAFSFYGGIENLFNETYSPGSDINGFGGRYYNAAAGRNYYMGVMVERRGKGKGEREK